MTAGRSRKLVLGIIDYVYEPPEDTSAVTWNEVVDVFTTTGRSRKTVENTIRDLIEYGAIHRRDNGSRTTTGRTLHPTTLGIAWIEQRLEPIPGQKPPDAIADADQIAEELAYGHLDNDFGAATLEAVVELVIGDPANPHDETRTP